MKMQYLLWAEYKRINFAILWMDERFRNTTATPRIRHTASTIEIRSVGGPSLTSLISRIIYVRGIDKIYDDIPSTTIVSNPLLEIELMHASLSHWAKNWPGWYDDTYCPNTRPLSQAEIDLPFLMEKYCAVNKSEHLTEFKVFTV